MNIPVEKAAETTLKRQSIRIKTPEQRKKFVSKSARLEQSLGLSSQLVDHTKERSEVIKMYYKEKLNLLKRNIENKEEYRRKKLCLEEENIKTKKELCQIVANLVDCLHDIF